MSNGEQKDQFDDDTDFHGIAESPSSSLSTHTIVCTSNQNKNTKFVKQKNSIHIDIIHSEYIFARKNGISKNVVFKVIKQI
ncbi:hypothetical protein COE86_04265 [Bacillus toyonensis]|uniref:hypothetical protein n=1 Tax=Bacillus toyonensis TaxID=155322 RepID=UPI000BFE407B|nr:hypothetical protein [Bacillus toyonensis]PHB39094.1 hypothetical protein COE86_04265 [Bacillus toyonensis]